MSGGGEELGQGVADLSSPQQEGMTLNSLVAAAHQNAIAHGFYAGAPHPDPRDPTLLWFLSMKMALVTSEVGEAIEELKSGRALVGTLLLDPENGKPEGLAVELADIIIRVFDLCGYLGIDLDRAVTMKMQYNRRRPILHGGKL